jgi:hypothetical protein
VSRRVIARYVTAYVMTATLGLPVGWALAVRHNGPPATARGATGLGAVVPAANSKPAKEDPHVFTMTGSVTELVPGRSVPLPVLVGNPNSQPIKILTVAVAASDPSAACRAQGNLSVLGYDAGRPGAAVYVVPGRGSATVPLSVQLVDSPSRSQNACKRVTFQLSYSGTAVQWGDQ